MYCGYVLATDALLPMRRSLGWLVLLFAIAGCATDAPPAVEPAAETVADAPVDAPIDAPSESEPAPPPAAEPPPPPVRRRPPPRRVSIAMVGDMMLGTDYPKNTLPDDDAVGFLAAVTPILSAADLTFGNLEGVLADASAEPVKACANLSACYLFRSPLRYADRFLAAGFDGLSLANNHARDFGEAGRTSSMQALAERGIAHSGRRYDFASIGWQGLDIAFMAFAVTRESNLLHDYALAVEMVANEARDHDLVIVSFHGGAEGAGTTRIPFAEETYYGEPRGNVVRFARAVVDAGADLVFGHGPHVIRGMERYRDRLIAYSLGNFATYYGISVAGDKGIAPILVATIDQDGRFIEGQVHSTVQMRPGGPQPDPNQQALKMLEELSRQDFREPGVEFSADGRIRPAEREFVRQGPEESNGGD